MSKIKTTIAPIGFINHAILFGLAIYIALVIYTNKIASLHRDYFIAFSRANVICDVLSDYGTSRHYNCENTTKNTRLTENDFIALFRSAKLIEENDYEKIEDIKDYKKGGPEALLRHYIVETSVDSENENISEMFLHGYQDDQGTTYGSIYVFVALFQSINFSQSDQSTITKYRLDTALDFIGNLTGYKKDDKNKNIRYFIDLRYNPFSLKKKMSSLDALKTVCRNFQCYDTPHGEKLSWYKDNPERFNQTLLAFGNFIITEINGHASVKPKRFIYQALQGPIQFAIIALTTYIFLLLLWRLLGIILKISSPIQSNKFVTFPTLFSGRFQDFEEAIPESRKIIDHLITMLPLIGLFGTVIGILLGLPEVAAVLNNSGPNSSEATNELFAQLGLAFSTTALAVSGVLILELSWILVQMYEDHQLWHAINTTSKKEDTNAQSIHNEDDKELQAINTETK